MRAATGAGTASSTIEKQPAASSASASSYSCTAFAALRPCALKPPSIVAVCGVRPMWPITGMPADVSARTRESIGPAPSSLTASAAASLTKRIAVSSACCVAHLVRAERQVGDHERPAGAAVDGAREDDHLVDRRGHGRVVAEHDHRGRVADEDQVDAGVVGDPPGRRVVRGHHHDAVAAALHLADLGQRQLARGGRAGCGLARTGGHERSPFGRGTLSISRVEPTRAATSRVGPSKSATST